MRPKKKAVNLGWCALALLVVALIAVAIMSRHAPVDLKLNKQAEAYVANLTVAEAPSCDQDHFMVTGTAQQDNVMFRITTGSATSSQPPYSSKLNKSDEFALPSPAVSEDRQQTFTINVVNSAGEQITIAEATTRPRCGGEE